jgi:hypothetical protein
MPEHEVRGERAVYDHETEDPRGARRRRPVADWGVGEELFDRMPTPRRRFGRTGEAPPARRDAHPRERRFEPTTRETAAPREDRAATTARRDRAAVREDRAAARVEPEHPTVVMDIVPRDDLAVAAPAASRRDPAARGGVEGRRTVVIGGQASAARRPRPSRTVGERVGPRPDRLAAYAVALGVLLILIAFLTQ